MKRESKIKIFISCFNNKVEIPDNDIFELVQAGAANTKTRFPSMSHDDEGENISKLNPRFNDFSTIYWAWKNWDLDYYGFAQYRRMLSFDQSMLKKKLYEYRFKTNDATSLEQMQINDKAKMVDFINEYEVITCNYLQYDTVTYSLYGQYLEVPYEHEKDINTLFQVIAEKQPRYLKAAKESLFKNGRGYFANIFVMDRKHFHEFCEFAFDVLFEVDDKIDYEDYNFAECRAPGFLGERLLGIYYTYLQMQDDCKMTALQKCFFDTTREAALDHAFENNSVAIAIPVDQENVLNASITVQSILDNASPLETYDIVMLYENLPNRLINRFLDGIQGGNVRIRFSNVSSYLYDEEVKTKSFASKIPYHACAIPEIFAFYQACIWLLPGTLVQLDIANLYHTKSGAKLQILSQAGLSYYEAQGEKIPSTKSEEKLIGVLSKVLGTGAIFEIRNILSEKNRQGNQRFKSQVLQRLNYALHPMVSGNGIAVALKESQAIVRWSDGLYGQKRDSAFEQLSKRCVFAEDFSSRQHLKKYEYVIGKGTAANYVDALPVFPCDIKPAFSEKNVAIGLMCSQIFSKYTAVTIQSILEHSSPEFYYDILIFHEELTKERKHEMQFMANSYPNVSIRFCLIEETLRSLTCDTLSQYIKIIYCRVLMGHLLPHYDQLVFVDSDMLVLTDLAELYQYEFHDSYVAAAHEWHYSKEQLEQLKIKETESMNAGFMVMNLKKFRESFSAGELLFMCNVKNWSYVDQDVLNILVRKHISYLDYSWNYRVDYKTLGILHSSECFYGDHYQLLEPNVVHFAGDFRPWAKPYLQYADQFWQIAQRTPFYHEILFEKMDQEQQSLASGHQSISGQNTPGYLPNLIPVDHPSRKFLDILMPKGTRRREIVKAVYRIMKGNKPAVQ